ncbi:MAG: thioesterase [Anaerolineae bacterium]|nr:thioesterase [Anaerolineae bacterium]
MNILPVWIEETRVNANDSDFEGKWKATRILQVMQEVGNRHAIQLGVGFKNLIQFNQAWVLSRLRIRFLDFPGIDEQIKIQTWPKGIQQKIFFDRHFKMSNSNGQTIALASAAYLLIDFEARKMLRPSALNVQLPENSEMSAIDEQLEKIPVPDQLDEQMRVKATYSTLDVMGHVNNTRYLEWIGDCFTVEHYKTHKLEWVQINYANEIKPGEEISLSSGSLNNDAFTRVITGNNLTAGNRAFEAMINWSPRN